MQCIGTEFGTLQICRHIWSVERTSVDCIKMYIYKKNQFYSDLIAKSWENVSNAKAKNKLKKLLFGHLLLKLLRHSALNICLSRTVANSIGVDCCFLSILNDVDNYRQLKYSYASAFDCQLQSPEVYCSALQISCKQVESNALSMQLHKPPRDAF